MTDGFTINVGLAQAHPNYTVLKRENNMKSISIINPAIMENTEYSIVRVLPSYWLKVGVSLDHGLSQPSIRNFMGSL